MELYRQSIWALWNRLQGLGDNGEHPNGRECHGFLMIVSASMFSAVLLLYPARATAVTASASAWFSRHHYCQHYRLLQYLLTFHLPAISVVCT